MQSEPIDYPTDDEEAAINAGIAADPDNPELDAAFFARARPAAEVMPPAVLAALRLRGPKKSYARPMIAIRLDPDLLTVLRRHGPGWQARINALLRKAVGI